MTRRWPFAVGIVVLAAAGAAVAVAPAGWKWMAIVAAVAAATLPLVVGRWTSSDKASVDRQAVLSVGALGAGRWRVRDITDPTLLRVHPSGLPDDVTADRVAARVPPFVPRDQQQAVEVRLRPGAFVLIEGESTAGKSRLAFEVLRVKARGHRLFAPEPAALGAAVEQLRQEREAVLWLDDLERFLETDVLTETMIASVLGGSKHRRMIVATIRDQARDALSQGQPAVVERRARILGRADTVQIAKRFTTSELDRAREYRGDPGINVAMDSADTYGLAEYLAAGPQLLAKWNGGEARHPRGYALVKAAVDVRRAGFMTPLPKQWLAEVHPRYLPTDARARIEDLDAAWAWATERWQDSTALLEPTNDSTGETVIVFDYLLDHVQRTTPIDDDPPDDVVRLALARADAETAGNIGVQAHQRGRYRLALDAFERAYTLHTDASGPESSQALESRNNVASVLGDVGRVDEAEREHRAVLDIRVRILGPADYSTLISRHNLGVMLRSLGRFAEAEREQRTVLDIAERTLGPEHPFTLTSRDNLARVLGHLGRHGEAEHEHRTVLDIAERTLGPEAFFTLTSRGNLAEVLRAQGKLDEAEHEQRSVLEARERTLGVSHPATLLSRNGLAAVLAERES